MLFHQRSRGEILSSILSGMVGVIVGVIIVITVISPNLNPQPASPVTELPQNRNSAPVREIPRLFASRSTDTNSIPDAVARVAPAVVTIDTTTMKRIYERGRLGLPAYSTRVMEIPKGMGTGVIVSRDGQIVTNNHVIQDAKTINVTLNDKRQYVAKVIGTDSVSDLAILKITDNVPFPVAELTSSENVRIGEWVATIGNPLGVGQTVAVGVLSARGRHINDSSVELRNLLQTDAAINPGNSGGPLVNVQGKVIGINTAIIPYAQGIGFAIPAESVSKTIETLKQYGRVVRPYLGVEMGDLTPSIFRYLELPHDTKGVVIGRVLKDSPAHKAGIESGDVIISIDGKETANTYELQSVVRSLTVGDTVKVVVIRDNQQVELDLTLEESPISKKSSMSSQNGVSTASIKQ